MKTLRITDTEKAFEILGDDAGYYGDNGGDPDGNMWLPSSQLVNEKVVENKSGYLVNAHYMTDDEITQFCSLKDDYEIAEKEDDYDDWRNAIETVLGNLDYGWAHYGAYGTMDSQWVIAK